MGSTLPRRGVDTRLGEAGYCAHCGQTMTGPDACIGTLPGVREACCGHGDAPRAYITYVDGRHFTGVAALRRMGRPVWP